jgi:hypothetical protein
LAALRAEGFFRNYLPAIAVELVAAGLATVDRYGLLKPTDLGLYAEVRVEEIKQVR